MYLIIGGDGRQYGPASAQQIRKWMAAGRANLDTQAKEEGSGDWKRLGDFEDFAAPLAPPPLLGSEPAGIAESPALASRGSRLGAFLIDQVIVLCCVLPFFVALPSDLLLSMAQSGNWGDWSAIEKLPGAVSGMAVSAVLIVAYVVVQALLLSIRGQTMGKWVARIAIVRFPDGSHAGFARAFLIRYLLMNLLYSVPSPIGAIIFLTDVMFIFNGPRHCLHDIIAGTQVVRVS